jgi:hypothetical protein
MSVGWPKINGGTASSGPAFVRRAAEYGNGVQILSKTAVIKEDGVKTAVLGRLS